MIDKFTLQEAIGFANEIHFKQLDKAGLPYILHPLRVMNKMETLDEMFVAVLHDIIEDTDFDKKVINLLESRFPFELIRTVYVLSREKGESYSAYIKRVETDPIAVKVKIADLEDNLNIMRLKKMSDISPDSLRMYLEAWRELKKIK